MCEQKECWECSQAEKCMRSGKPFTWVAVSLVAILSAGLIVTLVLAGHLMHVRTMLIMVSAPIVALALFGWAYVQHNVIGRYFEAYLEDGDMHVHPISCEKVSAYRYDVNTRGEKPRIVFRIGGYWKRGFVIREWKTSDETHRYKVSSWTGEDLRVYSSIDERDFVPHDLCFFGALVDMSAPAHVSVRKYLGGVLLLLEKTDSMHSWIEELRKRHDLFAAYLIEFLREIERNRSMGRSKHVQWIRESLEDRLGSIPEDLLREMWGDDEELKRILARRGRRLVRQMEDHSWPDPDAAQVQ